MAANRFGARVTYETGFGGDRKDTEIRVALDRDARLLEPFEVGEPV